MGSLTKSPILPLALGAGAIAAPFMFPSLGAGLAGAGVAAGTGSTAGQMAAGLSLPSVMGTAASGVPASLAGMALSPAQALAIGTLPGSVASGSFGGAAFSGLKDILGAGAQDFMNNPANLARLGAQGLPGQQAEQQAPPMVVPGGGMQAAPPPAAPTGSLADAAAAGRGPLPQMPGTTGGISEQDLLAFYLQQQGGGATPPLPGMFRRTESVPAPY